MRKNIFLDFLSPDNWKTYPTVPKETNKLAAYEDQLIFQLKNSINAAVLMTLDYCLLPPAFIVQSRIAFRAVYESSPYLDAHLIYLPLREISIDQYIAKKVSEYESVKSSHFGFYTETHWAFLSKYQQLLTPRDATMGITIAKQWISLPDDSPIWKPIVLRNPKVADHLRPIPMVLKEQGKSVTLEAVLAELKTVEPDLVRYINQAIQHEYLKTYISEYDACIISGAPPKPLNENFLIPVESCFYDYRLFSSLLDLMGIRDFLLCACPETIIYFIQQREHTLLINVIWEICSEYKQAPEVKRVFRNLIDTIESNNRNVFKKPSKLMSRFTKTNTINDRIYRIFEAWKKMKLDSLLSQEGIYMNNSKQKVFIVHGHNADVRNQVELFVRRIGLEPIILFNEPSGGKTVIEKFEAYSDVSFAIILYTACDEGREKGKTELTDRARQNVVFEHGYFCAKLGRGNVVALHEDGVEIPSDLSGVVFLSLNSEWQNRIKREMDAAGIKADWLRG